MVDPDEQGWAKDRGRSQIEQATQIHFGEENHPRMYGANIHGGFGVIRI